MTRCLYVVCRHSRLFAKLSRIDESPSLKVLIDELKVKLSLSLLHKPKDGPRIYMNSIETHDLEKGFVATCTKHEFIFDGWFAVN